MDEKNAEPGRFPAPVRVPTPLEAHRVGAQCARNGRSHGDDHLQDGVPNGFLNSHKLTPPFRAAVFPLFLLLQFARHVEARALLGPLLRLHRAVAVPVGAEVTVAADAHVVLRAAGGYQLRHQQAHHGALFGRAGVRGMSMGVQPAFVADADAVGVVAAAVRARQRQGPCAYRGPVTADVEVIADVAEAPLPMRPTQLFHRERAILARGAAMDDDVVYTSFHN